MWQHHLGGRLFDCRCSGSFHPELAVALLCTLRAWNLNYYFLLVKLMFTVIHIQLPFRILPESLHWMITQKNVKGIKEYIDKASKFNNKKVVLEECMTLSKEGDSGQAMKRSVIDIFRSKTLIFHLVLFSYIASVQSSRHCSILNYP
jgi:hypothetical protein